jgi:nucleoside-diphosphate-sugar epimerase
MARVLALGGAGFVGSYVVRGLLGHGYEVTVVDNFSKYGFLQHDFYTHPGFTLKSKDIRAMYPTEFRGYDFVLCLAALIGGIRYFHKIPYQIARDNTEILACAIDNTLAASPGATFVYFSSSMVYERMQRPVTEEDALNQPVPITNYGMQKLFGEFLVRGAHHEFGLNYLIVRPFNAAGSGELPEVTGEGHVEFGMAHVIPDFVYKAITKQTPFEILGDGEQVRTFTHAKDIAEAVRIMLDKGVKDDDFNICGNNTYNIADLAQKIWAKVNPGIDFPGFRHLPVPPADVRFRIGKSGKARGILGWEPKYDLNYIIEDTVSFIKQSMGRAK